MNTLHLKNYNVNKQGYMNAHLLLKNTKDKYMLLRALRILAIKKDILNIPYSGDYKGYRSEERAKKVGSLRKPKAQKNLNMPFSVVCSVLLKSICVCFCMLK